MMKTVESIPPSGAQLWPLSITAYRALAEMGLIPQNTELLYGQVYQKMAKSPYHCFLITRLLQLIQPVLPAGLLLRSEQPITCGHSEPEPDLSIVRGAPEDFLREHPLGAELVIEVCVSSRQYDLFKLRAYAEAGVKEAWLVLAPEKQVQTFARPVNGRFLEEKIAGPGGRLACSPIPEFTLELEGLFTSNPT